MAASTFSKLCDMLNDPQLVRFESHGSEVEYPAASCGWLRGCSLTTALDGCILRIFLAIRSAAIGFCSPLVTHRSPLPQATH